MALELNDVRYQLHSVEGNSQAVFELSDQDQSSSTTQYFGYMDLNGRYIILKRTFTTGITAARYTYGRSGYTTAWTNRASLSYDYYDALRSDLE